MWDRVNRRWFIATGATALIGVGSGCSAISDWREEQARNTNERLPRLCETFRLRNGDTAPHIFHVLIERDGEIMTWRSSDEVPAHTGIQVTLGDWHTTRGAYVISGSYDEYPTWDREDVAEYEVDGECFRGAIEIDADGSVEAVVYDDA